MDMFDLVQDVRMLYYSRISGRRSVAITDRSEYGSRLCFFAHKGTVLVQQTDVIDEWKLL